MVDAGVDPKQTTVAETVAWLQVLEQREEQRESDDANPHGDLL